MSRASTATTRSGRRGSAARIACAVSRSICTSKTSSCRLLLAGLPASCLTKDRSRWSPTLGAPFSVRCCRRCSGRPSTRPLRQSCISRLSPSSTTTPLASGKRAQAAAGSPDAGLHRRRLTVQLAGSVRKLAARVHALTSSMSSSERQMTSHAASGISAISRPRGDAVLLCDQEAPPTRAVALATWRRRPSTPPGRALWF
jgi:hypothetical protein